MIADMLDSIGVVQGEGERVGAAVEHFDAHNKCGGVLTRDDVRREVGHDREGANSADAIDGTGSAELIIEHELREVGSDQVAESRELALIDGTEESIEERTRLGLRNNSRGMRGGRF